MYSDGLEKLHKERYIKLNKLRLAWLVIRMVFNHKLVVSLYQYNHFNAMLYKGSIYTENKEFKVNLLFKIYPCNNRYELGRVIKVLLTNKFYYRVNKD